MPALVRPHTGTGIKKFYTLLGKRVTLIFAINYNSKHLHMTRRDRGRNGVCP